MLDALQLTLTLSLNPTALLGFVLYVATACVLLALFQFAYTKVTPHNEWALIRANNTAAAIALGGAIIGFALPASNVIAYSVTYGRSWAPSSSWARSSRPRSCCGRCAPASRTAKSQPASTSRQWPLPWA